MIVLVILKNIGSINDPKENARIERSRKDEGSYPGTGAGQGNYSAPEIIDGIVAAFRCTKEERVR